MVRLTFYPTATARGALILAHGAGAGQRSPFMVATARALSARGIVVATFDFAYMADRRRLPDKGPVLEETWRDAIAEWREQEHASLPLFIGGKSMGGRIASQVAALGNLPLAGLVFLGYPLHPPGKPAQRRDAHLPSITAPMLFVQGSRDAFGTTDEIRKLVPRLPRATLFEVEAGDHSFKVPRGGDLSQDEVFMRIYDRVAAFVTEHSR